jgi:hypothetical protein
MKHWFIVLCLSGLILLAGCTTKEPEIIIEDLDIPFTETLGEKIPVVSLELPYSTVKGNISNFIHYDKPVDINPLLFTKSTIKTHQLIITMDAIYPIGSIEITNHKEFPISEISIDTSFEGLSFKRIKSNQSLSVTHTSIALGGTMAKSMKLTFKADETVGLSDVTILLGNGLIVKEETAWSNTFLRYDGWSGADGIFSFNLTDGNDRIGASKDTTGFIFSDTFVGKVNSFNNLRQTSRMINNSLGYFNHQEPFDEAFSFDYVVNDGLAYSPFVPDAYIGKKSRNLLDGEGLTLSQSKDALFSNSSDGTSWLSDALGSSVTIDFKASYPLDELYLWNYAANPEYGTKRFELSFSIDGLSYETIDTYTLEMATANDLQPYTMVLTLGGINARYLKIKTLESYHETYVGLGKLMILSESNQFLFGEVTDTNHVTELHPNELSSRLWIQDGVVLNGFLYTFPILVKDYRDFFMVHNVGMIKTPIRNERIIHQESSYHSTPLQVKTSDGGIIYYGAGVMNNVHNDGFIYVYGYKDFNGRYLVSARFLPEDIENMNAWTYYDGSGYTSDINLSYPIILGVSAELSVSHIETGMFAGKYMLVVMENTTSGKISYALSDTPYGPFTDYVQVFQTIEHTYLRGAFTYNAKMHPNLSEPGSYLISYNVNTTQLGALSDARIYYPRFIRLIEVKS